MSDLQKYLMLALATVFLCSGSAPAALWTGAVDQDWNNAGNWDAAPGGTNAIINTATGNYPIVSSAPTFTPVDIFVGSGATGRLDQLTGTLDTGNGNWMFVGQAPGNSNGTYNLANTAGTGGAFTGYAQGDGSLNVGGASQNGVLHVGIDGATAVVNVNTSGTVSASQITTGSTNHVNNSTFNVDNGTINVGTFRIGGDFGWGTNVASNNNFNMSGGTITTTGETWLGGIGVGTSTMTGGTINSGAWLAVGRNRLGTNTTLDMTGGTINAAQTSGWLVAGGFDQGTGTINASGGVINSLVSGIWIGEGATGTANLSGNVDVNGGWFYIGGNDGSIGEVNITGSSVTVDATNLYLGLNGSGVDTTAVGTLNFIADPLGISTILLTGDVNLSSTDGDFLGIDLAAYTGPYVDLLLIDGLTSQGEFTGLAQGAAVSTNSSLAYAIDYSVAGDVWLRAVPEPSSLLLMLASAGLFAGMRKRVCLGT